MSAPNKITFLTMDQVEKMYHKREPLSKRAYSYREMREWMKANNRGTRADEAQNFYEDPGCGAKIIEA